MSYEEHPDAVQLDDADRDSAHDHIAAALKELSQLAGLISRTLGRDTDSPEAFTRVVIELPTPGGDFDATKLVDVGVSTFCAGTECLGVYDALAGVCRPCTPSDHACDH